MLYVHDKEDLKRKGAYRTQIENGYVYAYKMREISTIHRLKNLNASATGNASAHEVDIFQLVI